MQTYARLTLNLLLTVPFIMQDESQEYLNILFICHCAKKIWNNVIPFEGMLGMMKKNSFQFL